jgi:hypothetical protein
MEGKRIINGKRNNIYKGHTVNVASSLDGITINNTYYDTNIQEHYSTIRNRDTTVILSKMDFAKWIGKIVDNISPSPLIYFNTKVGGDYEFVCRLGKYYTTYELNTVKPGLNFMSPSEQIDKAKEFRSLISTFKKKLKKNKDRLAEYFLVNPNDTSSVALHERFFNEFDICLAENDDLPF